MLLPDKVRHCADAIETLGILQSSDVKRNRSLLQRPLTALSLPESFEFGHWLRSNGYVEQFIRSLLLVDPEAVNPSPVQEFWSGLLRSGKADFCAEILSYVSYTTMSNGCFARDTVVDIYDFEAARSAIFHETFHTFNFVHGPVGVGWNEGSAIALPKWCAGEECDLGETVFGTVLYYRDIGIENYPRAVAIGSPLAYDKKGQEFARWLMGHDVSGIDWFDPREVERLFNSYWVNLNRNVPWEEWLAQVEDATGKMRQEKKRLL